MKHAVLGAGGVGGFIGSLLGHAGDGVTLLLRSEALAAHPETLSLESPFGNLVTRPARAAALRESVDVLWIAVKATQLDAALGAVPDPGCAGTVVPLLNGIDHVEVLRSRFGDRRVVPATIAIESERVAPGRIVHRSPFANLAFSAAGEAVLGEVAKGLARQGCTCAFPRDERTLLWHKLAFLAPLALTTAASGTDLGGVLSDPARRAALESAAREACAVAAGSGARVDAEEILRRLFALPPAIRSSMLKDVEARRPPELDAIAGPILRGGSRLGIGVAATARLAAEIRARVLARACED